MLSPFFPVGLRLPGRNELKEGTLSNGSFCPSIQPNRIASTTRSAHVADGTPDPTLGIRTQSSLRLS